MVIDIVFKDLQHCNQALSLVFDLNICDQTCKIGAPVPICENANKQYLVDEWRAMGKKVILSFGGAGMGGEFR